MKDNDTDFYKVVSIGATFILLTFTGISSVLGFFAVKYVEQIELHAQATDDAVQELNKNLQSININLSGVLTKISATDRELEYNRSSIIDLYNLIKDWEKREGKYWAAIRDIEAKIIRLEKRSSQNGK